jgi:hypothetical protein
MSSTNGCGGSPPGAEYRAVRNKKPATWAGFLLGGSRVYWMRTMLPFGSICTRSPTRMALASGTETLL